MPQPLKPETAYSIIDEWLNLPNISIFSPTKKHWQILKELLIPFGTAGNLNFDAHLANLAIEHSGCIFSTDNDFGRFKSLHWKNPLL